MNRADRKKQRFSKKNEKTKVNKQILDKVEPKPTLRLNVNTLENQRARKAWNMRFGDMYNSDGTLKTKYKNNPDNKIVSKKPISKEKLKEIKSSRSGIKTDTKIPVKPKSKATPGTSGMGSRAGVQTGRRPGTNTAPTGKGGDKTLMPKSYTIKSGDTLTAIAKKMGTTVAMLKQANGIKDANKIRTGQKLKLYKDKKGSMKEMKPYIADRPRTVEQAQKMGKKYFFDKSGNKKVAVTAAQLKKSGLTLSQWLKKK